MIEGCLPEEGQDTILASMRLRVACFHINSLFADELLQVDEAVAVLGRSDETRLHDEQKTCREQQARASEYKRGCRAKSAQIREALGGESSAQASRGKKRAKGKAAPVSPSTPRAFRGGRRRW